MSVVKLTRPIKAHGDEIAEITLREPTGDDVMELGYPFSVGEDGATTIKAKVVGRYVVKLADIPMSSVKQICPADFLVLAGELIVFFGVSEEPAKTG